MSTDTSPKTAAGTDEYVDPFSEQTAKVTPILSKVRDSLVSLTEAVKDLAVIVVDIRAGIIREGVKSKKTEKPVNVPDWNGASDEYRGWYRFIFRPMLESMIPAEEVGRLEQRIQNAVQNEIRVKGRATKTQLDHLGLKASTKSQTQNEKRNGDKQNGRQSEERFNVDALVEFTKTMPDPSDESKSVERPVREAAQGIAAMSRALEDRTRNLELPKAEEKATDAFLVQSINSLIRCRMHLGAVETHEEAVADVAAAA